MHPLRLPSGGVQKYSLLKKLVNMMSYFDIIFEVSGIKLPKNILPKTVLLGGFQWGNATP